MAYESLESVMEKHCNTPEYQAEYEKVRPQIEFYRSLLELRKSMGLSQTEFAELMGVKQPAIARLESGDSLPNLKTLYDIAKATGKELQIKFV